MSGQHHGSRFIQHHYDDAQHQFDSGKLGMWVFLTQEILFFSALFVAYIVYRAHHPEIFYYAHKYLDVKWGAINTVVLLVSSLTAAWAVRAAQMSQRNILIGCLATTIVCAFGFLGIKYVEYSHKIHDGLLFGTKFAPAIDNHHRPFPRGEDGKPIFTPKGLDEYYAEHGEPGAAAAGADAHGTEPGEAKVGAEPGEAKAGGEPAMGDQAVVGAAAGQGDAHDDAEKAAAAHGDGHHADPHGRPTPPPPNTNMFFTIYFAMTGLHGLHVLIGILVFVWLLVRAIKGHFTPDYFGPVDYAALYWHLVDLIWIYLFPLLYLIH